jgi:hypothetical protein
MRYTVQVVGGGEHRFGDDYDAAKAYADECAPAVVCALTNDDYELVGRYVVEREVVYTAE